MSASIPGSNLSRVDSFSIFAGVLKKSLLSAEIEEKIRSIDALQIELIGGKIIERVMNNLGAKARCRILKEIAGKTLGYLSSPFNQMMMINSLRSAETAKPLFSEENTAQFMMCALSFVKQDIADSFSTPHSFIQFGRSFEISDCSPRGFLAKTVREIGLQMGIDDVPVKYTVYLKLNKQLTEEKSELVFDLIDEFGEAEFPKETFTLNELSQQFEDALQRR